MGAEDSLQVNKSHRFFPTNLTRARLEVHGGAAPPHFIAEVFEEGTCEVNDANDLMILLGLVCSTSVLRPTLRDQLFKTLQIASVESLEIPVVSKNDPGHLSSHARHKTIYISLRVRQLDQLPPNITEY